jgi:glc operon protein GlcG
MTMKRLQSLMVGAVLMLAATSTVGAQQPAAAPPPPPPPYGPAITLEQAKKVMAGAEAEAIKNKWNVVIAVLDSGGNLVALQRMDGAQWGSIEVAREKAYSAVAFRRPTKAFEDAIGQGGGNLRLLRLTGANPIEGGLPIVVDGKLVGGIGVSGVTAQQDGQIGRAGVEALK